MGLSLITPAAGSPVTLAEAKAVCGIEGSAHDALLALLMPAAVDHLAEWLGTPLGVAGYRLTLDGFSDAIELPKGPVNAVSAVGYLDAASAPQVVSPAVYSLDLVNTPQWVVRNSDASWPTVLDAVNVVTVDFTAGYGATIALPAGLKLAVLGLIKHWFENGGDAKVPDGVYSQAGPWRTMWISA